MSNKKIMELVLTNIKKHRHYAANIQGNHFMLIGKNGTGKSTIRNAIDRLLLRATPKLDGVLIADNNPEVPITAGEDNGKMFMMLSDDGTKYSIEERISKDGKSRFIFTKHGTDGSKAVLTPAQQEIKKIFGNSVDLSPLMELPGNRQFEFLQKSFQIDVSGYTTTRQNLVDDRRLINREIKTLNAKLLSPEYHLGESEIKEHQEEIIVTELQQKKKPTEIKQREIDAAKRLQTAKKDTVKSIDDLDRQILALQNQKKQLQTYLSTITIPDIAALEKELQGIKDANAAIDTEIANASKHNQTVALVKQYQLAKADVVKKENEAANKSAAITKLDDSLKKALKEIKFSDIYPGLELKYEMDEDNKLIQVGLYLRDLPFHKSQQSFAEMIKVIIKLSAFVNPDGLNFVSIGQWNELDDDNQKEILNFAKENPNVQLGIEKVDNNVEIITEFIELT